jgi:ABC-type Na+ efflux pump permease subunit
MIFRGSCESGLAGTADGVREFSMGGLFYHELLRMSRKGRSTYVRCAYVLALFAALYVAYRSQFPEGDIWFSSRAASVSSVDQARLAYSFAVAILFIQTITIFVVTPIHVADSISGERERKTLDLLLATPLSDREIVLSKLAARGVHLFGVLLAGLPLLALTQLWGGVDFRLLLAAFVATGLNIVSVSAFCYECCTSMFRNSQTPSLAVVAAYIGSLTLFSLFTTFVGSPVGIFLALADSGQSRPIGSLGYYLFVHTGTYYFDPMFTCIAFNCYFGLMFLAPPLRFRDALKKADDNKLNPSVGPISGRPPVGCWPFLWREMDSASESITRKVEAAVSANLRPLIVLSPLVLAPLLALRWCLDIDPGAFSYFSHLVLIAPALLWCGVSAIRASDGICGEREAGSLDNLLTLPVSSSEVLGAKWLGPAVLSRGFGYLLAAMIGAEIVVGRLNPLGALLLAVTVVAHVCFLAGLGLWLSIVCRTTRTARIAMAIALLLLFIPGFPYVAGTSNAEQLSTPMSRVQQVIDVANPVRAWWLCAFSSHDLAAGVVFPRLFGALCALPMFGVLAGTLWLDARRRFRRFRLS